MMIHISEANIELLRHLSVLKAQTFEGPKTLQKSNTAHFLVNFTISTF